MGDNVIARILFIIGIAQMVIGILSGLILGNQYSSLSVFFTWTIGGFVMGMLFIGFAENIRLLHEINQKTIRRSSEGLEEEKNLSPKVNEAQLGPTAPVEENIHAASWRLEEEDRNEIKRFYADKELSEIVPSPYEGYCLVKLEDGESVFVRVVDINGFGVQEVQNAELKHQIIKWYNDFK